MIEVKSEEKDVGSQKSVGMVSSEKLQGQQSD